MNSYLGVFLINICSQIISFLTNSYVYFKVSVSPISKKYKNAFVVGIGSLIIGVLYAGLRLYHHPSSSIVSYIFPSLFYILFEKKKRLLKGIVAFLSTSITKIVYLIPLLLCAAIVSAFYPGMNPSNSTLLSQFLTPLINLATFFIVFLILKVKRFKNGFQFFQKEKNLGLGLALSGLLFILFSINYAYEFRILYLAFILIFGSVPIGFGLYLWIRRSITAHYRERLQLKSEEHYQELLEEKEQEIEKLNQSNEFLAKIVHRDNHLMSALDSSINAYLESDDKTYKENLMREIKTLAKERGELIEKEQRESKILPSTGNMMIDGAISDLYIKSSTRGIDFNMIVSETVDKIIGKYISQTDLQTLISDHIKDAVIAVDAAEKKGGKILVELSVKNDNYTITAFDNGVDFEIETLAKLGKERVTTHAETGGSGIGFMTTFETLRKAHASLVITEFENKTPFSKSISFLFDGENTFSIQSYRSEKLRYALSRDDIIIR